MHAFRRDSMIELENSNLFKLEKNENGEFYAKIKGLKLTHSMTCRKLLKQKKRMENEYQFKISYYDQKEEFFYSPRFKIFTHNKYLSESQETTLNEIFYSFQKNSGNFF